MITISLGGVGSGKTASMVMEMATHPHRRYYSNIKVDLPNVTPITKEMIIKRIPADDKGKKFKLTVNKSYWESQPKPIFLVWDEFHVLGNSRRGMSAQAVVISEFFSLIRRVVNSSEKEGACYLISQYVHRIDLNQREMADSLIYHLMRYLVHCEKCNINWLENSDVPTDLKIDLCPYCGGHTFKKDFFIECFHFLSIDAFFAWRFNHYPTYYRHYFIQNISNYFGLYDTMTWDNLISNDDIYVPTEEKKEVIKKEVIKKVDYI